MRDRLNDRLLIILDLGMLPAHFRGKDSQRFEVAREAGVCIVGQQQGFVHVGGSGLGLSLVRAIVNSHRGEIGLESEPGKGTVFHVWLPAARGR